jgi:hypothetical protein
MLIKFQQFTIKNIVLIGINITNINLICLNNGKNLLVELIHYLNLLFPLFPLKSSLGVGTGPSSLKIL